MNNKTITLIFVLILVIEAIFIFYTFVLPKDVGSLDIEQTTQTNENQEIVSTVNEKKYISDYNVYTNEELGFTFSYPQNVTFPFPNEVYSDTSSSKSESVINPVTIDFKLVKNGGNSGWPEFPLYHGGIDFIDEDIPGATIIVEVFDKDVDETLSEFIVNKLKIENEQLSLATETFFDGKQALTISGPMGSPVQDLTQFGSILFVDIGEYAMVLKYWTTSSSEDLVPTAENQIFLIKNQIIGDLLSTLRFF